MGIMWHESALCSIQQSTFLISASQGEYWDPAGTKQVRLKRYRRCGRCANGGAVRAGNGVWLASNTVFAGVSVRLIQATN